jgi:hypothetical protein
MARSLLLLSAVAALASADAKALRRQEVRGTRGTGTTFVDRRSDAAILRAFANEGCVCGYDWMAFWRVVARFVVPPATCFGRETAEFMAPVFAQNCENRASRSGRALDAAAVSTTSYLMLDESAAAAARVPLPPRVDGPTLGFSSPDDAERDR